MSRGIDALITPSVMEWARKKAGLDPLAAANKIGRPIDEILKWEAGEIYQTRGNLETRDLCSVQVLEDGGIVVSGKFGVS